MQTSGLFPGNAALELTRKGQAGRIQRFLYAKSLQQQQANLAVGAALRGQPANPANMPYLGLSPGFNGLGETSDITFNDDGSINTFAVDGEQISASSLPAGTPGNGIITNSSWTPTYSNTSTPSDNGSWTGVLSSFFGAAGSIFGKRPVNAVVPLPTTGPSTAMVLGIAALVGIPAIYLLTRKG
jgi:hypothetical protein